MSTTAIIKTSFLGRNGTGAVSVPDLLTGDVKLALYIASSPNDDNRRIYLDQP